MAIASILKELRDQLWEPDRESADVLDRVLEDLHRGAISDPQVRARINVSYSVKGVRTTDTTLEWSGDLQDYDEDRILAMRQSLSLGVDALFPPPPLDAK